MRLCMFHPAEQPLERGWPGRIDGEHVTQLAAQTLQSFFTGGGQAREHAVYPLARVQLLAPVLHPPAVRVFEDERTFAFANPAAIRSPGSIVAGGALVVLPRVAAVVGAEGQLAGFTLLADWRRRGVDPPKDRDFALGLGPVVITGDAPELDGLELVVRVDGEELSRDRLDGFDWVVARELAAAGTRLYPGDLIAGPSLAQVEVEPGSSVELDAPAIGVLAHSVARR
jgi:hypothetical protein